MTPPRATPLSPDDRRAAIVGAVTPLLLERGQMPSTRDIARAAGIAEGTIYRVFEDKHALLHAVAEWVLRPPDASGQMVAAMRALPDLRARVAALAKISAERMHEVHTALGVLRPLLVDSARGAGGIQGPPTYLTRSNERLMEMLTDAFAVSADELRVEPQVAATAFRALMLGARSPGMPHPSPLTPDVVADLLLDGLAAGARTPGED